MPMQTARLAISISDLVQKYIGEIKIEGCDFVPFDNAVSDAAYLLLNIPTKMLVEYLGLKKQRRKLPDGEEFWKETNLVEKLRGFTNYNGRARLGDVLDFLVGRVQCDYQKISDAERIWLSITEIPEMDED